MKADFSTAFREQVQGWLHQFGGLKPGEKARSLNLGSKRLVIAESLVCPPNYALADILVVLGNLQAGPGNWFAGPVLVGGACEIGEGSRLMALAAGTRLVLGDKCEVSDWVDSNGPLILGAGSTVRGGAASRHSIQIGHGVEAMGMFAPAISSPGFTSGVRMPDVQERPVEILPPGRGVAGDWSGFPSFQRSRLTAIGKDTWIYDGSVRFEKPVILKAKLVTRGSFHCSAASLLDGDVKAGGDVSIGPDSIVNGSVTARGDLNLGANCLFSGELSGAVTVSLGAGTRGYRDGGPVEVTSGAAMHVASNVLIRGEMRSGAGIRQSAAKSVGEPELVLANA